MYVCHQTFNFKCYRSNPGNNVAVTIYFRNSVKVNVQPQLTKCLYEHNNCTCQGQSDIYQDKLFQPTKNLPLQKQCARRLTHDEEKSSLRTE